MPTDTPTMTAEQIDGLREAAGLRLVGALYHLCPTIIALLDERDALEKGLIALEQAVLAGNAALDTLGEELAAKEAEVARLEARLQQEFKDASDCCDAHELDYEIFEQVKADFKARMADAESRLARCQDALREARKRIKAWDDSFFGDDKFEWQYPELEAIANMIDAALGEAPAPAGEPPYTPDVIEYEEGDQAEFVTKDGACIYEERPRGYAVIRDMETREIIGVRFPLHRSPRIVVKEDPAATPPPDREGDDFEPSPEEHGAYLEYVEKTGEWPAPVSLLEALREDVAEATLHNIHKIELSLDEARSLVREMTDDKAALAAAGSAPPEGRVGEDAP